MGQKTFIDCLKMLDNKKLKEIENRIKHYIMDDIIKSKGRKKYVNLFLTNANNSLQSAKLLLNVSTDEKLQIATGYLKFNGYLWTINASYYSMFYIIRALLENSGIEFKSDLSIHALTFDALIYYFYKTKKLQKSLIKLFIEAQEEAAEILGKETADELISNYFYEKRKRAKLTYETGELAMQNKAKTSVKRAEQFNREIKKILELY